MKKILNEQKINEIATKLSHFLADTFLLYVKTLNFHWNMVGSQFFMYHKLLENQYKELADALDEIAERIRQLGKKAPGTLAEFLQLGCLKEPQMTLTQEQMIFDLIEGHEKMVDHCHSLIELSDNLLDQGTSDLITDQIRYHAKQAWLLRSHYLEE